MAPYIYGEYYWKDGSIYKGDFVKGLREGKGIWINEHGDRYEGPFRKDKKNGIGTTKNKKSQIYKTYSAACNIFFYGNDKYTP